MGCTKAARKGVNSGRSYLTNTEQFLIRDCKLVLHLRVYIQARSQAPAWEYFNRGSASGQLQQAEPLVRHSYAERRNEK